MRAYYINDKVGYNPLIFLPLMLNIKNYCLFTYSHDTIFRVLITTGLSITSILIPVLLPVVPNIPDISGYGHLVASFVFALNLLIFISSLMHSRSCSDTLPDAKGRVLDIYAAEWFLVFFSGTMLCSIGSGFFESIPVIIFLNIVASIVFIFACLPYFGDKITSRLRNSSME